MAIEPIGLWGWIAANCPPSNSAGGVSWWMEFNKNDQNGNGHKAAGKPPFIEHNKPYTSVLKVRRTKKQAYLNDALLAECDRGPAGGGAATGQWKMRDPQLLGLAVWSSNTTFTRVELVEVTRIRGSRSVSDRWRRDRGSEVAMSLFRSLPLSFL